MNWHSLCSEAARVHLDVVAKEARMLELETRARTAEGRAEGAWNRLMASVGPAHIGASSRASGTQTDGH